jgi:preprotein translocase subunit SecG
MENVLLTILLINALLLIGIVLLQRSEGGGLGMGGGGGIMTGRSAATAMAKLTWVFGVLFFACSMALTIVAARNAASSSVVDRGTVEAPATGDAAPALPAGDDLLPPPASGTPPATDAPATPPRAD